MKNLKCEHTGYDDESGNPWDKLRGDDNAVGEIIKSTTSAPPTSTTRLPGPNYANRSAKEVGVLERLRFYRWLQCRRQRVTNTPVYERDDFEFEGFDFGKDNYDRLGPD